MIKKILAKMMLLTLLILTCCLGTAGADTTSPIKKAPSSQTKVVNEYDMIKNLQSKTDEELLSQGLKEDQIQTIRNIDIAQEIYKIAKEDDASLIERGYSPDKIAIIRNFNGTEEQVRALSATLTITASMSMSYYSSTNTTNTIINYNWSWNQMPNFTYQDIVAIAWDPSMYQSNNWQTHDIQYSEWYYSNNQYSYTAQTTSLDPQSPGHGAKTIFSTGKKDGTMTLYTKRGYGHVSLTKSGYMPEAAAQVYYGHNQLSVTPSVSFPGGISVSFSWSVNDEGSAYVYATP